MSDRDRDALWRPGFTGEVSSSRPAAGRRRRWPRRAALVALGVAIATVGALLAHRTLVERADESDITDLPRLPQQVAREWGVDVPAVRISHVTGSRQLVVFAVDSHVIVALDGASGARRWQASVDGRVSAVRLIGDRTLVQASPTGAQAARITAFDRADGQEVWRRDVDAGADVSIGGGQVLLARRTGATATAVEVIDATTGTTRTIIGGDDVTWDDRTIQRRMGTDVELIDRASLRTVADVDLAPLGLPLDDRVAAVRTPSGVVVVAGDDAVLVGEHGDISDSIEIPDLADATGAVRIDALDRTGSLIALQRGDELVVVEALADQLQQRWSERAWLIDHHADTAGGLVALATVDGSIVTLPARVVDAGTGALRWRGAIPLQRASPMQLFAADGVVTVAPKGGRGGAGISGFDLDHRPLWFQPLADSTTAVLVDQALVTLTTYRASGTVTVALYG